MNIYDYNFINNENEIIEMSSFKEKTILIVNVASNCGFTKNYEELQSLYQDFNKNGLEIIGFPCNQFGEQEPGTDEEIKNFCQINYGVTFPISKKIEVNGENAHPIYKFLKNKIKNNNDIGWNFEKFLILKNGEILNFSPNIWPHDFLDIIKKDLGV